MTKKQSLKAWNKLTDQVKEKIIKIVYYKEKKELKKDEIEFIFNNHSYLIELIQSS